MLASCPPSVYEPVAITELSPNRQMDIPLGDVRIKFSIRAPHCYIVIGGISWPRALYL